MKPRVLVLDEGFVSGALTAVGLRDAGFHVTVVAGTGGRGAYRGRDIFWRLAPAVSSDAYLALLDGLVRTQRFDHVLPLTEPIQSRLWDAAPHWSGRLFPRTEEWQRAACRDKQRMSALVSSSGVAVPDERDIRGEDDVVVGVATLGLPVVVKGIRGRGGAATCIAGSLSEAIEAARALKASGVDCFLQRYVDGPTVLVGGVFAEGSAVRLYAGEKVEQYPPRTGPGSRLRSVRDPSLIEAALVAMRALRVTGIASADFVRDAGGRYLFLELNARPWGSMAAATAAEVDLFTPLGALVRGERPTPYLRFREGVECTVFPLSVLSAVHSRSRLAVAGIWRDLLSTQPSLWWPLGQGAHVAHRLVRVARNWSSPQERRPLTQFERRPDQRPLARV